VQGDAAASCRPHGRRPLAALAPRDVCHARTLRIPAASLHLQTLAAPPFKSSQIRRLSLSAPPLVEFSPIHRSLYQQSEGGRRRGKGGGRKGDWAATQGAATLPTLQVPRCQRLLEAAVPLSVKKKTEGEEEREKKSVLLKPRSSPAVKPGAVREKKEPQQSEPRTPTPKPKPPVVKSPPQSRSRTCWRWRRAALLPLPRAEP
jgi:hypothetical protein